MFSQGRIRSEEVGSCCKEAVAKKQLQRNSCKETVAKLIPHRGLSKISMSAEIKRSKGGFVVLKIQAWRSSECLKVSENQWKSVKIGDLGNWKKKKRKNQWRTKPHNLGHLGDLHASCSKQGLLETVALFRDSAAGRDSLWKSPCIVDYSWRCPDKSKIQLSQQARSQALASRKPCSGFSSFWLHLAPCTFQGCPQTQSVTFQQTCKVA